MPSEVGLKNEREEWLHEAVLAYLQAVDDGRPPSPSEFLARYPDLAGELSAFFDDQEEVPRRLAPLQDALPSTLAETRSRDSVPPAAEPLPRFPDHEVLELVATGGMGKVYRARQVSLDRFVALKCIRRRRGADSATEVRRLIREARNAANLDHPHIVPIWGVYEDEDAPFFSMKFIEGGSLAQALRSGPFHDQREVARLLAVVARAVHHAHQRGILHRDLKPGNILIDRGGQPHVADFGLAKRVDQAGEAELPAPPPARDVADTNGDAPTGSDRTALTMPGAVVGTASYMAPEQARGEQTLSTAADVYGVGAVLYQMLTGRPPFRGADVRDTLRLVRETEPDPPRKVRRRVARDLEAICLKCLSKDPAQRYGSAEALAEDLERFDVGKPVKARPVNFLERTAKWARRRPAAAALAAAVVLFALLGVGEIWWRSRVTTALLKESQENLYVSLIGEANSAVALGHPDIAEEKLDACPEALRQWEWYYLKRCSHRDAVKLRGHTRLISTVQYDRDGSRLATASLDGTVILWDAATGEALRTLRVTDANVGVTSVCFSGDGRTVITASRDRKVRVYDVDTGALVRELADAGELVAAARAGDRFAVLDKPRTVTVWGVDCAEPLFHLPDARSEVNCIALSPDGSRLAVAGFDRLLDLWDLSSGKPRLRGALPFPKPQLTMTMIWSVAFSNDGKRVAASYADLREWDAETGAPLGELSGSGDFVCYALSYSPDDRLLAATDRAGYVRVWDRTNGRTVMGPKGPTDIPPGAVFSPREGAWLLAVTRDREVIVEDLASRAVSTSRILKGHEDRHIDTLAFSPDETRLASRAGTEVILWDVARGRPLHRLQLRTAGESVPSASADLAFSRDGRLLVAGGAGGRLQVWDVETGRECDKPEITGNDLRCAAFSDDGAYLAVGGERGDVALWDLSGGRPKETARTTGGVELFELFALRFRPGGRQVLTCGRDGLVRLWDPTGTEVRRYKEKGKEQGHTKTVTAAAFSPNDGGGRLATASADRKVRVWDTDTGWVLHVLDHSAYVSGVSFSKDGRRLATCASDGMVKLWDADSGREIVTLDRHDSMASCVAFSPATGHLLASCGHDGTIRLWDATPP
jgi:WD40 repeat protein